MSGALKGVPPVILTSVFNYFILLINNTFQLSSLIVQLNNVVYPPAHKADIERLCYNVRRSEVVGPGQGLVRCVSAYYENWNIVNIVVLHKIFQHTKTVHNRHHDIQQHRAQLIRQ